MEPSFDIDGIILKYVRDRSLSPEEAARLGEWLAVSEDRMELIERMKTDPDWVQTELRRMEQVNTERIWTKFETRIKPTPFIPLNPYQASLVDLRRRSLRHRNYLCRRRLDVVLP